MHNGSVILKEKKNGQIFGNQLSGSSTYMSVARDDRGFAYSIFTWHCLRLLWSMVSNSAGYWVLFVGGGGGGVWVVLFQLCQVYD